jgi:hypothetical protein
MSRSKWTPKSARFGNHLVVVKHRSSPVKLGGIKAKKEISQVPSAPGWLARALGNVCGD